MKRKVLVVVTRRSEEKASSAGDKEIIACLKDKASCEVKRLQFLPSSEHAGQLEE